MDQTRSPADPDSEGSSKDGEGLERLARLACRTLSADAVAVRTAHTEVLHARAGDEAEARFRAAAAALCDAVQEAGEQILHHDGRIDLPVGRFIGVPLDPSAGTAGGVLAVFSDEARPWTAEELEAAREVAGCVVAHTELRRVKRLAAAERQRYRELLANVDAVVWEMDPETGRFTYVNSAAERILGFPVRTWLEQPDFWPRMVHPEDRAYAVALCARATAECEDHDLEYRAVAADGRIVWLHDHVRALPDERGVTCLLQGVMVDVTEKKEAHHHAVEQLRRVEEQFRQITEHVRELFWIFSPDFTETIYMSPAYERLWGRSLAELYGDTSTFMAAVHPEDLPLLRQGMADIANGPVEGIEYRIHLPDGSVRWMVSRGAPVHDEHGNVYRVVGTTEDVTERKELEAERVAAERHYRRLVQNAPYAIYVLDAQARFTEMNPAAAELLGRSPGEMIGRSIADVVVAEDLPLAMESIRSKAAGEITVSDLELRMIHASGELRLAKIRATAIIESGEFVGTHGIAADITEERAREQESRLLAAALHNLEEGVAIARPGGALLYVNATYAELLGFDPHVRPFPNFSDFAAGEQQEDRVRAAVRTVLAEGRWAGRITFRHVDGARLVPLEFILGRVDSAERETLLFIIARDISGEIAREEHLRRAERLASVGTLIGGVAHELNNPLSAITSFATLLLESPLSDEEREDIATIHREALRAAKIVADLRLLARRTQDDPREHVQVDLNDVVTHVLRTRRYAHETGNIMATLDLANDLPPVWGDPGQLEQVVINLVVNAEHALEQSAGDCRLILRTRPSTGGVSLHVIDNGAGIPAHVMERIFDPFFTTKATGEGTGLGLSLVHSIVMEHGGDVRVESKEGSGTAFHLEFPAVRDIGQSRAETPAAPARRSLRILIVDDEPAIRRALVRYLTRRGHDVTEAGDGAEALGRLSAESRFDVILSDLRMPGLSGDRMLERLREQGGDLYRRVMFLTGDAASGHAARILADSEAPVVFKPIDLPELAQRIEEWADQIGRTGA